MIKTEITHKITPNDNGEFVMSHECNKVTISHNKEGCTYVLSAGTYIGTNIGVLQLFSLPEEETREIGFKLSKKEREEYKNKESLVDIKFQQVATIDVWIEKLQQIKKAMIKKPKKHKK